MSPFSWVASAVYYFRRILPVAARILIPRMYRAALTLSSRRPRFVGSSSNDRDLGIIQHRLGISCHVVSLVWRLWLRYSGTKKVVSFCRI